MSNAFPAPAPAPAATAPKATGVSSAGPQTMIDIEMPNGAVVQFPASMSEEDIKTAAYKLQGTSAPEVGFWQDTGNTLRSLPARAVTRAFGAVGDVDEMLHQGSRKLDEWLGRDPDAVHPQRAAEMVPLDLGTGDGKETLADLFPTTEEVRTEFGYHDPTPPKYGVNKMLGEGLETALASGPFAPIAAGARGTAALLRAAFGGGAGSEAAHQAAEGTGYGGTTADTVASFFGGLLGAGAVPISKRVITPKDIPAPHVEARRVLQEEGIDVTPGQANRSNKAMREEGGAWGGEKYDRRQAEQVTAAAMRRVGEHNTRYATQDVMQRLFRTMGDEIDGLSRRNQMVGDNQLITDAQATWRDYARDVGSPESMHPFVRDYFDQIAQHLQNHNGILPGDIYQNLRSQIRADARAMFKNPSAEGYTHGTALNNLADDLDDAMERSIATNNPNDLGRWREVRGNYRNLMVIEKALSGAGSDARLGIITPQALAGATAIVQGRRGFIIGQGPFARFANAAEALVRPLPETGFSKPSSWSEKNLLAAILHPATQTARWASMRPPVSDYLNNAFIRGDSGIRGRPPLDPLAIAVAQGMTAPQSTNRTGGGF